MISKNEYSQIYDKILKNLNVSKGCYASIIPINTVFIKCENVAVHTTEEPTRIENLAVKTAAILKEITRVELYILTGLAPELIDKELEKLRSQGYLEYVLPYDSVKLNSNIKQLINEVGLELIVEEHLNKLKKKKILKQYYVTKLGEKLIQTGKKDSIEESDIEFIFLRDKTKWNSIAYFTNSSNKPRQGKRYTNVIDEADFMFFEAFLKSNKDDISITKRFKEFTQSTMIYIDELETYQLWIVYPKEKAFLQRKLSHDELNLKTHYPVKIDKKKIINSLDFLELPTNRISLDLPQNAPLGCSLALIIDDTINLDKFFMKIGFSFSANWTKDWIFNYENIEVFSRILIIPYNEIVLNEFVIKKIQNKYTNGKIQTKKSWEVEIQSCLTVLENYTDLKGSTNTILKEISDKPLFGISEEIIKNDINMRYKDKIEKMHVVEEKNELFAYCTLAEDKFRYEFLQHKNDWNNGLVLILEVSSLPSLKYYLYIISSNSFDYIAALFANEFRGTILRYKEIEKAIKSIVDSLPSTIKIGHLPNKDELINSIENDLGDEILIAEELVNSFIQHSSLMGSIKSYSINYDDEIVVEAIIKTETINDFFNTYKLDYTKRIIFEEKPIFKTEQDVPFYIVGKVESVEAAKKLLILRLAMKLQETLLNYLQLKKSIIRSISQIYSVSSLGSIPAFEDDTIKRYVEEIRKFTDVKIKEEEIKRDIFVMFKNKNVENITFIYSKEKISRVEVGIAKFLRRNISKKNSPFILGKEKKSHSDSKLKINYRLFIYPCDIKSAFTVLFLRAKALSENKLLKFDNLISLITEDANKLYNKIKSYNIKLAAELSDELIGSVATEIRKTLDIILEDVVATDLYDRFGLYSTDFDTKKNVIIAMSEVNHQKISQLYKENPELFDEDYFVQSKKGEHEYSYSIQLLPMDSESTYLLALFRTSRKIKGKPISREKVLEIYHNFAMQIKVVHEKEFDVYNHVGIIEQLRDLINEDLIIKEEVTEKLVRSYFGNYNEIEISSNSAKIFISRKTIKHFYEKCKNPIKPQIKIKNKLFEDIVVTLHPQDKKSLFALITFALVDLINNKNIYNEAILLFRDFLSKSQLKDKKKQELIEDENNIIVKLIKNAKDLSTN